MTTELAMAPGMYNFRLIIETILINLSRFLYDYVIKNSCIIYVHTVIKIPIKNIHKLEK